MSVAHEKARERRAPANARYRKRVDELVSWGEILAACGYEIQQRSLPTNPGEAAWRPAPRGIYFVFCTLHSEGIASMCLYPSVFHCFGCGAGGDKVDFAAGVMHLCSAQAIKRFFAETFPQMCKE